MNVAAFLACAAAVLAAAEAPARMRLDCAAAAGWIQEGSTRAFEPDDLFGYMDGNAEGYLQYGFTHMDGITCRSGRERLIIDVSEMADFEHAFGMFSSTRDPAQPTQPLGMGGQITPRRALFAKDRYYVELATETGEDRSAPLAAFAASIEAAIPGRAQPPEALGWFPSEGLEAGSVHLVPESVLGIRALAKGYVGRYAFGEAFVVAEPSPSEAAALMTKLRARWPARTSAEIADEAFRTQDAYLGGLLIFRKGARVAGFAKLGAGTDVSAAATRFAERLP